jgi:hypothetical protein
MVALGLLFVFFTVCRAGFWALVSPVLSIRKSYVFILLYSLWIAAFWGITIARVYYPPESLITRVVLVIVMTGLWLAYPLLQAFSTHFYFLQVGGDDSTWRDALAQIRKRYLQLLVAFSALIFIYGAIVSIVYSMSGDGWAEFFRNREAEMEGQKISVMWEGYVAALLLSAVVGMIPAVMFPIGIFVGFFNPSSDYFFATAMASLVAVGLTLAPMLWLEFWLPDLVLSKRTPVSSLLQLWRMGVKFLEVLPNEISAFASSFGLWLALTTLSLVLFISSRAGDPFPDLSLGRWPAPASLLVSAVVVLGLYPGVTSVAFQYARIRVYRRLLA